VVFSTLKVQRDLSVRRHRRCVECEQTWPTIEYLDDEADRWSAYVAGAPWRAEPTLAAARCPKCNGPCTVLRSGRPAGALRNEAYRRKRHCLACEYRWVTIERLDEPKFARKLKRQGRTLAELQKQAVARSIERARPQIVGHVRPAPPDGELATLVEQHGWPPPGTLISYMALRLLAGMENETSWSEEVQLAVAGARGAQNAAHRTSWPNADVREQMRAGSEAVIHQWYLSWRRLRDAGVEPTTLQNFVLLSDAEKARANAARVAAKRQSDRRSLQLELSPLRRGPKGRKHLELTSIADGHQWRRGRPQKHAIWWLHLKVEILREWRARACPGNGRGSIAEALAVLILKDLRVTNPAAYASLRSRWEQHIYENEAAPIPALVKILRDSRRYVRFAAFEDLLSKHARRLRGGKN
jgi:transcriptional regulator NrdR family protein